MLILKSFSEGQEAAELPLGMETLASVIFVILFYHTDICTVKCHFGILPLAYCPRIQPCLVQQLVGTSAGLPQAKQLPGSEHSLTISKQAALRPH